MTLYLDEDMVGTDTTQINYPHLLLCAGVTIQLSNGRLIGGHITNVTHEEPILAELKRLVDSDPGTPVRVYIIANLAVHNGKSPMQKASTLGFFRENPNRIQLVVYDTKKLNPDDGTFARLVSSGGRDMCTVYAVRDQTVRPYQYTSGANRFAESKALNHKKYNTEMDTWDIPNIAKKGINGILPAPLNNADFKFLSI
jgi:hypothetical protein